jgi:hypothetical protein
MHPIPAFLDDLADFVETVLGSVVGLQSATGHEARADDSEDGRVEEELISVVERAIDEDVAPRNRHAAASGAGLQGAA